MECRLSKPVNGKSSQNRKPVVEHPLGITVITRADLCIEVILNMKSERQFDGIRPIILPAGLA